MTGRAAPPRGGTAAREAQAQLATDTCSAAYAGSGIATRLRLVRSEEVVSEGAPPALTMEDAIRLARKSAGLDPNP